MSAPDSNPADRIAVAYAVTLDAHDRLLQAIADSIATDDSLSKRKRREWLQWYAESAAEIADLRATNPFPMRGAT